MHTTARGRQPHSFVCRCRGAGDDGQPVTVDSRDVDAVVESWLIEDRWWTDRPLRRRYWELVTDAGANTIVFRDLRSGGWYEQR